MRLLRLLLSSSIICIATMAMKNLTDKKSMQCNALNYNLSDNILPLHYNIALHFTQYNLQGKCVISVYVIYATQHINFYVSNSIIKSIIIRLKLKQTHSGMIYNPKPSNYNYENNIVLHNFNATILPGIYDLHIWFQIPINIVRESFGISYINKHGNRKWLITTGIQTRKQQIFPFWNEPGLRITFDISINHPRSYDVLSNMPIRESSESYDDTYWTYFNTTVLNSIDNVAFVIFDFHRINLTDTLSMWCRPQSIPYVKFASYIIESITMYFGNYWNNSKKFLEWTIVSSESKVNHVAIPNLQDDVKQVLGFVFHRETDIMYNEELDTAARKTIIAPLIARRMIQKYMGNLLNPSNWFQLWLNEGFIMFLQVYIVNEVASDFQMMDLFIVQIQHELLDLNTYLNISSVIEEYDNHPENNIYTFLSHVKGSIIWRMLERTLLPDKFSKGINIYLNNQYAEPMETTSDNLWNAMQSIIDELDFEYQFNIKNMVYSWAMQICFPVLKVTRNYFNNVVTISVQFHNMLDERQYYIPVTYTMEKDINFTITWTNIWLTPSHSKIELYLEKSIDQWVIFNLQQAGYYRVYYDTENWQKIAGYLNSEEYKNIHVLNRAQIIDDAFHFAMEKKLKFSLFWELATYLRKEKDYIAWYPMIKAFEFLSNIFPLLEFQPQFKKMLKPLELEWEIFLYRDDSNAGHTKYLMQELTKWKCIMDDMLCIKLANIQLQWHLNHKRNKISPGWKRWTYCNGLKTANNDTWAQVYNDNLYELDHTISKCLAYIKNSKIIINYLKIKLPTTFMILWHNPLYKDQTKDRIEALIANIYLSTLAKNTKYIFEEMKNFINRFKTLRYFLGKINEIAALTVIINSVYSEEQVGELKKFVELTVEGPILSDVERKIKTRWSEIERDRKFLESLFIE